MDGNVKDLLDVVKKEKVGQGQRILFGNLWGKVSKIKNNWKENNHGNLRNLAAINECFILGPFKRKNYLKMLTKFSNEGTHICAKIN